MFYVLVWWGCWLVVVDVVVDVFCEYIEWCVVVEDYCVVECFEVEIIVQLLLCVGLLLYYFVMFDFVVVCLFGLGVVVIDFVFDFFVFVVVVFYEEVYGLGLVLVFVVQFGVYDYVVCLEGQ